MHKRYAQKKIREALADTPVVVLVGPRQVGKTTLVKQFCSEGSGNWAYVTLDDKAQLDFARDDPVGFVRNQSADHVVIDEVQRAPDLFLAIKQSVDENRLPGRFLLTGSANAMLLPQLADSLAGRIEVIQLLPLTECEVQARESTFFESLLSGKTPQANETRVRRTLIDRILQGGFPEPMTRKSAARRESWFFQYIETVTQKDVKDLGEVAYLKEMPLLVQALCHQSSQLTNITEMAGKIGLTRVTVTRYLELLKLLFIFEDLNAWHSNRSKRLIKTPKVQMLDTGLLCALLQIDSNTIEREPKCLGPLLETYIYCELRRISCWTEKRLSFYHYRDKDGLEVDIVIETPDGKVIGIEVKASATIGPKDFRGLERLKAAAGEQFLIGILLYDGDHSNAYRDQLHSVPIACVWS